MGVLSILAGLQELAMRTLQELAKTTTACSNAMNALDAAKADRLELHAVTIPAAGWKKDDHGCYIDLDMPGLTADDSIAVLIEPDSADAAKAAVLDSTTQSSTDTLRLRAWKMPTEDLHAHYYTIREDILMALGTVAMGVGNYVLPPATANTLGGVMIGDGLTVDETGKTNVDQTVALACFPVGIVISMVGDISPAALFGGTWEEIAQDRALMGASRTHAAGTTVEAGLPNIKGSSNQFDPNSGWYTLQTDGAFYTKPLGKNGLVTGDSSGAYPWHEFGVDASRYNSIYGASDTVQPAAYYVHIWHRVA